MSQARRELRRDRTLRKRLEAGEVVRQADHALIPLGARAVFAVWPMESAEPSSFVLSRLGSLATASFDVWRQQGLDRSLRRRLHQAQRQLAQQEQNTEQVLRRAAHDIKAPLSAMKGYVDMMVRGMAGPLTPTMQRYLDRLREAIERQRQMIDVLLHAPPAPEEAPDLKAILMAALDRSKEAMDAKRMGLELVAPAEPCRLRGDASHLEMLMRRLVRQVVRTASRGAVIEAELCEEGKSWTVSLRAAGGALDVRGWSVSDAIARRLGGSVDINWSGGVVLHAVLPREPAASVVRPVAEPSMEQVLH